jgi:hypothetical protein
MTFRVSLVDTEVGAAAPTIFGKRRERRVRKYHRRSVPEAPLLVIPTVVDGVTRV